MPDAGLAPPEGVENMQRHKFTVPNRPDFGLNTTWLATGFRGTRAFCHRYNAPTVQIAVHRPTRIARQAR
jgi:hypothetical protein